MAGGPDRDRIVWVLGIVALVLALVVFVSENAQTVRVDLVVATVEMRLGWAVLSSVALGFLAGSLMRR